MDSIKEKRAKYNYAQEKAKRINNEWYNRRSIFGNNWAIFYILLGGREAGKSYTIMDMFLKEWKRKEKPFIWLRLTEASVKKMLSNNADKLVDADLKRKYDLDLKVKGIQVFDHGKPMCKVLALSTFYSDKGVALFDNEFFLGYNICLDEMQREKNERNTFDINYAFVNQMENLVRSTKDNMRIVLIGNTLEEASDIMCSFGFIPDVFGRYYIRKKRAVLDYIPPSEKYLKRRKGTVADLLAPNQSNFTNELSVDKTLIWKGRLYHPNYIIKFGKDKSEWFTVWDGRIIAAYNGENKKAIPMRPYLDLVFTTESRDAIMSQFDLRVFKFRNLFVQKTFARNMALLRPNR